MCPYAFASRYRAASIASKIRFEVARLVKLYSQCGMTLQDSAIVRLFGVRRHISKTHSDMGFSNAS